MRRLLFASGALSVAALGVAVWLGVEAWLGGREAFGA